MKRLDVLMPSSFATWTPFDVRLESIEHGSE